MDYQTALEYYEKYLTISQELKNQRGIGLAYNNMGVVHRNLENDSLSYEYFVKAIDIFEKFSDKQNILWAEEKVIESKP